ncbi:hypothetical protein GCM10007173_13430 [Glutamicibacter ardleyensis]|uniref:Uncharacterized protein n=1 Tax=Glutamicibacter ardleyensis TaxID=225894 RepID=A0ABQ2DGZ8_9MICC|nr:hypothetical protein GCM10007173_13430 [Glutamicibacter ardleyensis]
MALLVARTSLSDPIGLSVPRRGMNMGASPSTLDSRPYTYHGTDVDVLTPNKKAKPTARPKITNRGNHATNCYCNTCQLARARML